MKLKTDRKKFTDWEMQFMDRHLSFVEVWELGKESRRHHTQDLVGIYSFRNIETNKIYVGSSHHIFGRMQSHASSMRLGKHSYEEINEDFKKYGKNSFEFSILTYCSVSQLHTFEKRWLMFYNESGELYNQAELDKWDTPKGRYARKYWN
ncbi:hypothetical protein FZC84_21355 [Rossellomorea vietnamensis]|uniref:GIY-YIG domain-containing protein n=1 Tax=Rossellomorea vietnamensis TaxID=218284 RepID=A0A5D4M2D6_9BACI|nr:GIY-YIG nuclease family protein [Rossellomorea vietnamensis]TYR95742.1 hypothetical protein FZC84_21355 [Rossellomorea vietnamensis]